jgi:RNA polymerase sigma-70 factor (ECF subfamily)
MNASVLSEARVESPNQLDSRTDQQLIARDWVVNLACRFTGSEDLALDVMQETFLYLLRKFPGFRLTANLKTFLYPAVKNLGLAARRKAGRYQSSETELHILEHATAHDPAPNPANDLRAALANLSAAHREVLLLRYVDGLALAEIADAVEVPLGTVKSRLHHALEALRQDRQARQFFEP